MNERFISSQEIKSIEFGTNRKYQFIKYSEFFDKLLFYFFAINKSVKYILNIENFLHLSIMNVSHLLSMKSNN